MILTQKYIEEVNKLSEMLRNHPYRIPGGNQPLSGDTNECLDEVVDQNKYKNCKNYSYDDNFIYEKKLFKNFDSLSEELNHEIESFSNRPPSRRGRRPLANKTKINNKFGDIRKNNFIKKGNINFFVLLFFVFLKNGPSDFDEIFTGDTLKCPL